MRKTIFSNGEYYHVYNRGVDKREVFLDDSNYGRFLTSLKEFNTVDPIGSLCEKDLRLQRMLEKGSSTPFELGVELPGLVEIIAYCLNPNHYHLILRQISDRGIEKFMHKVNTGYTNYFNKKNKRSGSLFQGRFKAIHIDSNDYLLYLSAYVNKNNFIHGYNPKGSSAPFGEWKYCSVLDYLGKRSEKLCQKDVILDQFLQKGSSAPFGSYEKFLDQNAAHFKEKKELEKYWLE